MSSLGKDGAIPFSPKTQDMGTGTDDQPAGRITNQSETQMAATTATHMTQPPASKATHMAQPPASKATHMTQTACDMATQTLADSQVQTDEGVYGSLSCSTLYGRQHTSCSTTANSSLMLNISTQTLPEAVTNSSKADQSTNISNQHAVTFHSMPGRFFHQQVTMVTAYAQPQH